MLIGELALIAAALFAGAALYVGVAEHPARLEINQRAALSQWRASYARARIMQGALALIGGGLAFYLWWTSLNWLWLVGALLLVANWPFTLIAILPVNRALEGAVEPERTPALLRQWGQLHAVRTSLGGAALLVMLVALHWRI